jgi:hypothetical protein
MTFRSQSTPLQTNQPEDQMMTETTIAPRAPRSLLAFLRDGRGDDGSAGSHAGSASRPDRSRTWSAKRLIALGMMVLIPLVGFLGASAAHAVDPPEDALKFSFYRVASSTTAFFSTVQEPGSTKQFDPAWNPVLENPGSAGSLLGYADPDFSTVSGWLASKLSGSSDAIGYETLLVRDTAEDSASFGSTKFQGMVDYAYFGAALKGMGLDGTSTGLSLGFMNMVSGGVVMMLYIMGGAVDFIFNAVIATLSLLNPFKLFYTGVAAISPEFAAGMVGNEAVDVGPLTGLANWIGDWYVALNTLAWTVLVPLFIGVLLFSLVMFKKMNRGGALKKILIRVVFIALGLPLLGTMYTGMLTAMDDASSDGNAGSTRVVMSTYVDFETWAMNSRLAVPEDALIEWSPSSAQPSGPAQSNVRNTALAINDQTLQLNLDPIVAADAYDASWSNQVMEGKATDATTTSGAFGKTVDMLARFMTNAQVTGAAFETSVKGDLTNSTFYKEDTDNTVNGWFEKMTKDANELNTDGADPAANPLISVPAKEGLRADGTGTRTFTSDVELCSFTGTTLTYDGSLRGCNLSVMSMYNYLNTDFGPTSMTMYSSSNVMSEATRSMHNSVNQVGTGTMSFLYWFNAVVLLGSFVLIGLGYAFSLLFSSIRRSFQIITAVPFATLGAIAAIAKVVVYSVALILEVIVTIFVYKIVQEFLASLPQIIEMPFAAALNDGASGTMAGFVTFLTSGWAFGLVVTLLSIIGVLIFTVMAMRIRKTLVKAVEEAVTKLVEKFMETQVGMPSGGGGGMAPALAGGLAAGAGASAATRVMGGGGGGKGAVSPLAGAATAAGPGAIATAGGNAPGGLGTTGAIDPSGDGGATGPNGPTVLTAGAAGSPGNGDPGSPLGSTPGGASGATASDEVSLGRDVEANGLSKPGETPAPQVGGDDALSAASASVENSAEGYKSADLKGLEAGKEGAQTVGHAGVAVGRGFAGDAAGAAESGGRALEHGGSAVAAGEQAKQAEADAGRSSLDKPDNRHANNAAQAQKVSQVGAMVANTAGTAGVASGGGKAPSTGPAAGAKASSQAGTSRAARPSTAPAQQSAPRGSRPSAPAPRTPGAPRQNAPTAQPARQSPPAPRSAPPVPRAAPVTPRSAPASPRPSGASQPNARAQQPAPARRAVTPQGTPPPRQPQAPQPAPNRTPQAAQPSERSTPRHQAPRTRDESEQ